ncbi:MAG: LemA family protein [Saprospiraceae bacterium]|nr:LemA family protein [Saprospiraceae bacterium]|tara:strand:+ start:258 stop:857 length:600 start_codon:yes stop_codon:yes gene_type:complete
MRKFLPYIILGVIAFFIFTSATSSYNSLVSKDEQVNQSWANVQSAYQRRGDLIPNLVNTVKGAAEFEKETLEAVVNARAKATSVTIDPSNITPSQLEAFNQAQSGLSSALSKLLVTVERYPELKAVSNFTELQTQLEGTENRIKVERDRFNAAVTSFNKSVRSFPTNLFAGLFGFQRKAAFESDAGSEVAPNVNFDFGK